MSSPSYWLAPWVDEQEITADWEVQNAFTNQEKVNSLMQYIEKVAVQVNKGDISYPDRSQIGDSIVAGRRIDLSGSVGCVAFECLRREIDNAFVNIWHYFDRIVVEGSDPIDVYRRLKTAKNHDRIHITMRFIADQIRLLLYIRKIGAESYVIFVRKPHAFCRDHWNEHAKALGILEAFDEKQHDKLVDRIIGASEFDIKRAPELENAWWAGVRGQFFDGQGGFLIWSEEKPTEHSVTCGLIQTYATSMISDVGLARGMGLPLVESVQMPWLKRRGKGRSTQGPTEESVALQPGPIQDHFP